MAASNDERLFGPRGVEDMITLDNLTEDTMLRNLQLRYNKNLIYTFTGSILVSVNPYKMLPIYEQDTVQRYVGKRLGIEAPHVFATADNCYRLMRDTNKNQSVIISGESGAGKTEATKLILQYLAAMTNKRSEIEQMILQSSPILEAFGNARTVRNNNSSRFGKLIEIGFDPAGYIAGAHITQYLLERSRIVYQAPNERNYHIFYQFLAGTTDQERTQFRLKDAKEFRYLNQSGCIEIDGVDDDATFTRTRNAMNYLGLSDGAQNQIFSTLAAVLHLGNVTFAAAGDGSRVTSEESLRTAAQLLGVDANGLANALTTRSINVRGAVTVIQLNAKQAEDARDAFAKAIYARLFDWLCARVNRAVNRPGIKSSIAVLDIFGFENFKRNSFEQLCINYTNEKLQLHFNEHIFKMEQEEYAREKISWSRVDFKDNLECINLIEKTVQLPGLISLLDEETKFPKATDTTFLEKITSIHVKSSYFEKPKMLRTAFVVRHYAGEVAYEVEGFLDKNRDTLQSELLSLVNNSKSTVVKEMFANMLSGDADQKKIVTVAGNFRSQLIALINTLSATNTHYVRCIKPNTLQKSDCFDPDMVLAQLRYAGMLETVRIRKMGYPIRFSLRDFHRRYGILATGLPRSGVDDRKLCEMIFEQLKLEKGTWQLGVTKIFLRDFQHAALEDKRNERIKKQIITIQAWWRMVRARLAYLQTKGAAVIVQKYYRRHLYRRRYQLYRQAVIATQTVARMLILHRRTFQRLVQRRDEIRRRMEEARRRAKEDEERRRREKEREEERARQQRAKEEERLRKEREAAAAAAAASPAAAAAAAASRSMPSIAIEAVSDEAALGEVLSPRAAAEQRKVNKDNWKPYRHVGGIQESPPIVTRDNIAAFPFMEFADLHFRKSNQIPKKGTLTLKKLTDTLRRRGGEQSVQEQISYTKKPIEYSLLPLDERLSKMAVDAHGTILAYEHPHEKKATDPMNLVMVLMRLGVSTSALRDELYCQLIKQTNVGFLPTKSQPAKEIQLRGWELLAFTCGTFVPTERLRSYVAAYLLGAQNHEHKPIVMLASYALHRLERAVMRLQLRGLYRMHMPALPELQLVLARRPLAVTIYLADETTKFDLELDSAASANEAVALFAQKLKLQDPSYFALFECYSQDSPTGKVTLQRSLFVEEVVADPISKGAFINNFQFKLVFKRKLYINPRRIPDDPVERNLLYIQASFEIANGTLPLTESDAVKLAALRFQHEGGDFLAITSYNNITVENALPRVMLKKRSMDEWKQLISVEHELLRGTTREDSKYQYLQFATQLLYYGSTVFPVETVKQPELPPHIELMMNIEGIHLVVMQGDNRNVVRTYFFSDFTVQISVDTILLVIEEDGKSKQLEFRTRLGPEIFNLFNDYFYWLQAQSEWGRAKEEYTSQEKTMLQFRKGELIHILDKEDPQWFEGESVDKSRRGTFPSKLVTQLLREPSEVRATADAERKKLRVPRAERLDSRDFTSEGARKRISSIIRPGDLKGKLPGQRLSTLGGRDSYNPRMSASKMVYAAKGKHPPPEGPRWQKIAVDVQKFPWQQYVNQQFKQPGTSGIAAFAKDPVKDSVLKSTDPSHARLVTELSRTVMRYMDDLPRAKATDNDLVLWIVNQVLPTPALVDETFVVVLKQLVQNPKMESIIKGWALLTVLCSLFMPGPELFPYIVTFALEQISQGGAYAQVSTFSKDCLERLTRHKEMPTVVRTSPPSRAELDAIIGAGLFGCQVYFEDKSNRSIDIDSITTVHEIIENLTDLKRLRGWAMFEVVSAENLYTEHILKPEECVCDVMSRWERFVVPKGVTGDVDFQFVFKKYVFMKAEIPKDLSHPAASKLIFYQVVSSVLRGRLPVAEEEAIVLAALHLQYEHGDYNPSFALEDEIGSYVPRYLIKEGITNKKDAAAMKVDHTKTLKGTMLSSLAQKVKLHWAGLQGKSKPELAKMYLQKLQDSALFGAMLFPVQYIITRKNIKPCLLAVNEEGLSVWDPATKQALKKIPFSSVNTYGPKKGSLALVTGSLVNPITETFNTDESFEISEIIKSYQTIRAAVVLAARKEALSG